MSLCGLNAAQVTGTRPGVMSRAISAARPPACGACHTCSPPFRSPSPPAVTMVYGEHRLCSGVLWSGPNTASVAKAALGPTFVELPGGLPVGEVHEVDAALVLVEQHSPAVGADAEHVHHAGAVVDRAGHRGLLGPELPHLQGAVLRRR